MEWARKAVGVVESASSNNKVINVFLVGVFGALCYRSVNQQKLIEALEVEKSALLQTNKSLKKSMWDWKQSLFADASDDESSPLSLSKLKIIYGEAPISQQGIAAVAVNNEDSKKTSETRIMI
ncbi:hypothetical protein C5167_026251 [Papaver somniferum]|uniref:uncharacterized protein LOC113346469 n=1 Tax=Papaver somniferum TaxID=3469 RepID=UPI000E6F8024|nr:uncharacterized protein LOC113346469 [Papaver somniferum]RZC94520.1 hypothetical protein C5167_026251 [Papaver somniferum]